MQIGIITVDGRQVGVVAISRGDSIDAFVPDLSGYVPQGRADDDTLPSHAPQHAAHHHYVGHHGEGGDTPRGESYAPSRTGLPFRQGSGEVDQAIVEASRAHHLDPDTMRSIASIESDMNPSSNANRATQYKGLYQIGDRGADSEWARFGQGNIYSAHDNALAAARMFEANRNAFRAHFGRDPTDTEMYMMHQQGLGFYTRGAMTNIAGNLPPAARTPENMTHKGFEAYWGREVARRKAAFAAREGARTDAASEPATMAP